MTDNNRDIVDNKPATNKLGNRPISKAELAKTSTDKLEESKRIIAEKEKIRQERIRIATEELGKVSSPGASGGIRRETAQTNTLDRQNLVTPTNSDLKKTNVDRTRTIQEDKKSTKSQKKDVQPVEVSDKKITTGSTIRFTFNFLINSIIILLLIQAFVFAYSFGYKLFGDVSYNPGDKTQKEVVILADSSSLDIAETLENQGIVEDKWVTLGRIKLGKYNSKLKPGTYMLSPSMTTDEIINIICGISEDEESNSDS